MYRCDNGFHDRKRNRRFLEENWELVKETADFMVDFVGWDPVKKVYSICAPVIPVQECHKAMDVCNPAFEVEYFRDTLRIAGQNDSGGKRKNSGNR